MGAPAYAGRPVLTLRGTEYPVLLPTVRDPRLHLAFVIVTLQVLGQTVFGFSLSIAQILVSLTTCALLEVGIAFFRHKIVMWPASALLTGNGVAFILRVPGTPHGDWWSLHGWWIFAGTAAVSLLSKHVIRYRGRHIFNPSNFGLVLCFLLLGKARAEPLDFWWGPMSAWMALALALIVVGGLTILSRLRLLPIAFGFWLTFAAGIGLLAATGHTMTARWHLGPITGWSFWWLLVTSPEILIFLFFMITDPKTIPGGRVARLAYAVGVGLLATLLIAPQTTERATKIAVLAALALVCAARPLLERVLPETGSSDDRAARWLPGLTRDRRVAAGALTLGAAAFAGLVVLAGIPARTEKAAAGSLPGGALPTVSVTRTDGVSGGVDRATLDQIAHDIALDYRSESEALRLRDPERAALGAGGARLVEVRQEIGRAAGSSISVPTRQVDHVSLTLLRGDGQGPPRIQAKVTGLERIAEYAGAPPRLERLRAAAPFTDAVEIALSSGHYVIVSGSKAASTPPPEARAVLVHATGPLSTVRLENVASQVGLDFRQGAFRSGASNDPAAMMGGGVCWLDYDGDGWLDLFVVNSYSSTDRDYWSRHGGLPRSALFHNVRGSFVNVSKQSGADLAVRGEGCVAADLNGDGRTDLVVTTDSGDRLLWNNGDGTFTEGARAAGIDVPGWHAGAAVADVNGDGRPDLFVAGYTDLNAPVANSISGFPSNDEGVRDLLYLNQGNDSHGHARFREVGRQAGLESAVLSHGLGAVFTDYNGDGRPDLYVANDEDANQLYENVAWPGGAAADPAGLGFRFEERGKTEGVADPYAGMGIAAGDYSRDGRTDLFVTNSRREPYAAFSRRAGTAVPAFRDSRGSFRSAYAGSAGWGATWADLALDGTPDLVLANGDIPVSSLAKDAARVQVLAPSTTGRGRFANVAVAGLRATPPVNGRGLAAADYDNNGTVDVVVNSIGGPLVLLRNTGESGHWLEVRLSSSVPGASARVVLPDGRVLVQEQHAGSSYLSSEDPRLHFGLGGATRVRSLVVRFPDGETVRRENVAADHVIVVAPPAARAQAPAPAPNTYLLPGCSTSETQTQSVARSWDEAAIEMERGDESPPVAARNLFHLSAAMWDAWSAYDPKSSGYFVSEKQRASDPLAARDAAISYAAYRVLLWRAQYEPDVATSFRRLAATMRALCYDTAFTSTTGSSPAALGNRIAAAAIAFGEHDGSLEQQAYLDPSYVPVNEPLVVSQPGTPMRDQTFWQPLAFGEKEIQGGLPIPTNVQSFLGAQWGHVRGFALRASSKGLPINPGPPPTGDPTSAAYKRATIAAIRLSARRNGAAIVARWSGEPAPVRWNAIANEVADTDGRELGAASRLEQDVKRYLALNAGLHDAAIAAWGAKRAYQSVRPISMIRALAFQGQSSDRHAPSYSADGLPLVPGLVEVITKESSAPGGRHALLAGHVGDIAVRTAHGWVLGTKWQPRNDVAAPPYPGWVSDESAFGHAASEVLAAMSGTQKLPRAAGLEHWRTYRQVAAEAALSGLDAGNETRADVVAGGLIGDHVGTAAWKLAERYFAGSAG